MKIIIALGFSLVAVAFWVLIVYVCKRMFGGTRVKSMKDAENVAAFVVLAVAFVFALAIN